MIRVAFRLWLMLPNLSPSPNLHWVYDNNVAFRGLNIDEERRAGS